MSVVGIDFGDESSYVAVARAGGIETVDNDYSLRATPSFVAFGGKQRILGVAAKNQHVTNLKNTVYGFKRLIGRRFNDPWANLDEVNQFSYALAPTSNGNIGVRINYLGEEHIYSAEQIAAMLFSKLKDTTESAIQATIHDCVISCPSFFSNAERQALLDAASMSGLHVLRLFNDTTATALSYGIYKQDLPGEEEPPRHVVFVDCGHSALQVFACAFNKGKLKMLSTTYDSTLGGRDFATVIATHFCDEFKVKYGINPQTNHRAYIRLLAEVEKLKKQMSANSTKLPFNIECFMDDKDVSSSMSRTDFERLAAPLFERVESCMRACFVNSGLKLEDVYAVEIVGGASRTPAIKALIEKVFGKTASTTLNQDEAVARGCALMCAILSPAFKVKEFSITDVQQHPIKIIFDEAASGKGEMEVFPQYHPIPFSKMLTFYRRDAFTLKAAYSYKVPFLNTDIGTYTISNVRATPEENIKIKVKANVNIHGIFNLPAASAYEKDDTETESAEGTNGNSADNQSGTQSQSQEDPDSNQVTPDTTQCEDKGNSSPTPGTPESSKDETQAEKPKKPKKQHYKVIELPIQVDTHGFGRTELDHLIETEVKLTAQDRLEKERVDVKNALEEYIYDLRDKFDCELREFLKEEERIQGIDNLTKQEEWLYEDGSDEKKSVYVQRLEELKKLGEPVKSRKREFDEMPNAIENLSVAISRARKVIDAVKSNDPSYDHLESTDIKKLVQEVDSTSAWLDQACGQMQNARKDSQPPILLNEIFEKKETFQTVISPIINKSKPKVEPPKEEPMDAKESPKSHTQNKGQEENCPPPEEQTDACMDVD